MYLPHRGITEQDSELLLNVFAKELTKHEKQASRLVHGRSMLAGNPENRRLRHILSKDARLDNSLGIPGSKCGQRSQRSHSRL